MKRSISAKKPYAHPTDAQINSSGLLEYARGQWEVFAAIAWKGYCEQGRGAVVIDSGVDDIWFPVFIPVRFPESCDNPPDAADIIRTYDPATQVVFAFMVVPPPWPVYVEGSGPDRIAPPEAYRKLAALV